MSDISKHVISILLIGTGPLTEISQADGGQKSRSSMSFVIEFRQGYAFWQFWSKKCQNSVIPVKKPIFLTFWSRECNKSSKLCLENANSGHF